MMADDWTVLQKPAIQQFIHEHEHGDPYQLVLKAKKYPDIPVPLVVQQIQARQKARKKLPEWYQAENIIFPPLLSLEQCSSEATARYKSQLVHGKTLIDLTGGAGVDTYYLSQSFEQTQYVEQQKQLTEIAQHNFHRLQANSIQVQVGDAEEFLELASSVDLIYIDPARRNDANQRVFRLSDCSPNVIQLLPQLLDKADKVLIKTSPMLDIYQATQDLGAVETIHVVAVGNECKEVLYLLSAHPPENPIIHAIDIQANAAPLTFTQPEEADTTVNFSEILSFIYEPNTAILKAGAFRTVANRWNLAKLHPNTHLYTSEALVDNFPGRIFELEAVLPYRKKEVQKYIPGKKANITTRNFRDSVATVRKKLGLKEGGDIYLFATRTLSKDQAILLAKKL
ncbi:MAG: hypothetical protein AAF632_06230 [Bacteroidota bacterium]